MLFKSKKEITENTEKRKGPRAGFYQATYFLPAGSDTDSAMHECWFSNIGEGGIAIETKENLLHDGDEIKILYRIGSRLRNDTMKVLTSRTRYSRFIYGCSFIEADEDRNVLINEYFQSERNITG